MFSGINSVGISRQPRRCNRRRDLSRLPFRRFRLRRVAFFFRELPRIPQRQCTLRCPSSGWLLSHVFTHRCRLPEHEGSAISFLRGIASLVPNCRTLLSYSESLLLGNKQSVSGSGGTTARLAQSVP